MRVTQLQQLHTTTPLDALLSEVQPTQLPQFTPTCPRHPTIRGPSKPAPTITHQLLHMTPHPSTSQATNVFSGSEPVQIPSPTGLVPPIKTKAPAAPRIASSPTHEIVDHLLGQVGIGGQWQEAPDVFMQVREPEKAGNTGLGVLCAGGDGSAEGGMPSRMSRHKPSCSVKTLAFQTS